jgi:hypothetical protein
VDARVPLNCRGSGTPPNRLINDLADLRVDTLGLLILEGTVERGFCDPLEDFGIDWLH